MLTRDTLGIIFANMHENSVREMTQERSMASLPFGGRYRLVDFALSSMVHAGISQVGVVTKSNYQSLVDHIGTGRDWDLARRRGISILSPYSYTSSEGNMAYHGRIEALYAVRDFIEHSTCELVLFADTDHVCSPDIADIIDRHIRTGADVTMVCRDPDPDPENVSNVISVRCEEDGTVNDIMINRYDENYLQSMNIVVVGRLKLLELIEEAHAHAKTFFERDILLANLDSLKVMAYRYTDYVRRITGLKSYYKISLELTDPETTSELFGKQTIYTKIHDSPPVRYSIGCDVKNSFVADGCTIEGTVENCILFRDVFIEKGAVVKNSVIMQNTHVCSGADLECVVTDKDVTVTEGKKLAGDPEYPLYIKKKSVV